MSQIVLSHPTGQWSLRVEDGQLVHVRFSKPGEPVLKSDAKLKPHAEAFAALLDGTVDSYPLPYVLNASPFYKKVWSALLRVPRGKVVSYATLAARAGNPKAYRAAASACAKNPLPVVVPCHRVVATNGIGGYAYGLELKRKLLAREATVIPD